MAAPSAPLSSSNALLAIDQNRPAVVSRILAAFDPDLTAHHGTLASQEREKLRQSLLALRADALLAASVAPSYTALLSTLATAPSHTKAASAGNGLVYNPITPCVLVDTRGYGAPIQGGVFAAYERRSYVPNGACGIPTSGVSAVLFSASTWNQTPDSGGNLLVLPPGGAPLASVGVFNPGTIWDATSSIVQTGPAGQFDVKVDTASAHVVLYVLGYFTAPAQPAALPHWVDGTGKVVGRAVGRLKVLLDVQGEAITATLDESGYGRRWLTPLVSFDQPGCTGNMYLLADGLARKPTAAYIDSGGAYQLLIAQGSPITVNVQSVGSVPGGGTTCFAIASTSQAFVPSAPVALTPYGTPPFFIE